MRKGARIELDPHSLTPHEDAYREGFKEVRAELESRIGQPGWQGASARVGIHLMEAYALALSKEMDAGTDVASITRGFAIAIGDVAASLIATFVLPIEMEEAEKEQSIVNSVCNLIGVAGNQAVKAAIDTLRGNTGPGDGVELNYDPPRTMGNA